MLDAHALGTYKTVFEEEIDRNGKEYPDINENCRFWLAMLPRIIKQAEADLAGAVQALEWRLCAELGYRNISGGFVRIRVMEIESTVDGMFYKLEIKHGIQSDCENRVETSNGRMNCATLEVDYADF